jgi:hypothetical protein
MASPGPTSTAAALAAVLAALAAFPAHALRAEIAALDPQPPAAVARDQPVYARIRFEDADGHYLWARPYFRGEPVRRAKSNASLRHSGSGEALGWFSLGGTDAVDEVRLVAGGGRPFREIELQRLAVDIRGTGAAGDGAERPEWVGTLRREADERHRQEIREAASRPPAASDSLIGTGFLLAVLALGAGGVGAPLWAVRRWRGPWRVAAALPLAAMAFVAGRIVLDTARDPTSHNLWPFEIVIAGGAGLAFLAALAVARRVAGAR